MLESFNGKGQGLKIAVITARFNNLVTSELKKGTEKGLLSLQVEKESIAFFSVPGSFEIPVLAYKLAMTTKYDAIICNGAVIRGETAHFDQVIHAVTTGLSQVALKYQMPIVHNVLACDTIEQALNRSGLNRKNKGYEAACVAVEMANLFKSLI